MAVFALADLHLSFGVSNKNMDVFGGRWINHAEKIERHWNEVVTADDLVLLAGDISWAKETNEALPDLLWIDSLPGTKVMIRGNHDYWWSSITKVEKILPPSIHLIQNNVFLWKNIAVAGSRLWDTYEFGFDGYIAYQPNEYAKTLEESIESPEQTEKIFVRELARLENSLKKIPANYYHRLAMTHYPPLGIDLTDSRASKILEKYKIEACVFGHVHNMKLDLHPFYGIKNGIHYIFAAGDYLDFYPVRVI
jgi:predicted phosphohydrolase